MYNIYKGEKSQEILPILPSNNWLSEFNILNLYYRSGTIALKSVDNNLLCDA